MKNVMEIAFSKMAPPLVNFREWVDECVESNMKIDLELGLKDAKPHLQNLDYIGIEDSLKKDNGGKIVADPFSLSPDPDTTSQRTSTSRYILLKHCIMHFLDPKD